MVPSNSKIYFDPGLFDIDMWIRIYKLKSWT